MIICHGLATPPLNGATIVTERVSALLTQDGLTVIRSLLSKRTEERRWRWVIRRLVHDIFSFARITWPYRAAGATIYITPYQGLGALLTCFHLVLCTVLRLRVVAHFHTWRIVADRGLIWNTVRYLCRKTPDLCVVVLCDKMAEEIVATGVVEHAQVVVLGNWGFVAQRTHLAVAPRDRGSRADRLGAKKRPFVVGHLSNLSAAKGLWRLPVIMRSVISRCRDHDVRLAVAGPFPDQATAEAWFECCEDNRITVDYYGPLEEGEKERFFESLDVFLFPSTYVNEVLPLVVLEALVRYVPVVTTRIGCLHRGSDPYLQVVEPPEMADAVLRVLRATEHAEMGAWHLVHENCEQQWYHEWRAFVQALRSSRPGKGGRNG